jgi:cephalosporin hydroxylase
MVTRRSRIQPDDHLEGLIIARAFGRLPEPQYAYPAEVDRPPTAACDIKGELRNFWVTRINQAFQDRYFGAPLCKLPEDLRTYEYLLWKNTPKVVIEIGAFGGGSALWFRDRLRTLTHYGKVDQPYIVSIELDASRTREYLDQADPDWASAIHLIEGDVTDASLADRVRELVPEGTPAMVVEDSAHVYETTRSALENFAQFVQVGGIFVVEDTCVDNERLRTGDYWPRGVVPALDEWLKTPTGQCFRVRPDLETYGFTTNPGGYLERIR